MSISNLETALNDITSSLASEALLDAPTIGIIGNALIEDIVSNDSKANFLTAWHNRGEKPTEVAHLADYFRDKSKNPDLEAFAPDAIDIVGTGGDKSGTFNISTTTAIIVAAGGVPVIKHGNRSITSKTGSADLLEAIGVPMQPTNEIIHASMENIGFTFLFAPSFHPAFKAIVPVRKELAEQGLKTVFNILGPLINPARPNYQLMGVFSPSWVSPLSEVLSNIGLKAGLVACSESQGQLMDEMTSIGDNTISPVGELNTESISQLKALIAKHSEGQLSDLKGGDSKANLEIFESVLDYSANTALLSTLCINAGAAFKISGKVEHFSDGYEYAIDILKNGKVKEWVQNTSSFFSTFSS